ncbi:MAG: zinc ribbon domain-containing protein [Pseudonocardiales bacterium]
MRCGETKLTLAEREFACDTCGTRLDRDHNAALNLAALADQTLLGELRPEVKRPTGNPHQTATGGTGYRHGKTQTMSQRRPRKVATP